MHLLSLSPLRLWGMLAVVAVNVVAAEPETRVFRDRGLRSFELKSGQIRAQGATSADWVPAKAAGRGEIELGRELVLEITADTLVEQALAGVHVTIKEKVTDTLFILEAANVSDGMDVSEALANVPGVITARPMFRRQTKKHAAYGAAFNDALFAQQWHLENRDADGQASGADLNVRGAWPHTRGQGIILAVVDDGVEVNHPDLVGRTTGMPHHNFLTGLASGLPTEADSLHGTAVAGLAVASGNNKIGVTGVAPAAQLASWIVLGYFGISEDALRRMYEHRLDLIDIQNHSWGWVANDQQELSALEDTGIERAFKLGRGGRGVVMVRAGGNDRAAGQNVNDEQVASDPRVIAVGAVRKDGRVTSYSEPGACVLVAAPSGDSDRDFPLLVTTDRRGAGGYNTSASGSPDYTIGDDGFSGTSASSPEIAGVVALVLSVNPKLTVRDVQKILALSARHFDLADPRMQTNGAGLLVSDNVGFGVPDAGEAVRMAKAFPSRPGTNVTVSSTIKKSIPQVAGVEFVAPGLHPAYRFVPSMPSLGVEPRDPTALLPLVHVGQVNMPLRMNLQGKGALIQRGTSFFHEKLDRAAAAGASFAIVYDNDTVNQTNAIIMGLTDLATIPAAFIGRADGEHIRALLAGGTNVTARLNAGDEAKAATYTFAVNETLVSEHVSLRISTDHPRRSDLRIVVESPSGTQSVMQRRNLDDTAGPRDYTYHSVQHFFESSAGDWKVHVYDEEENLSGSVYTVELNIRGVAIADRDRDGLDDAWETKWFSGLEHDQLADPDGDGYSNAREHAMGSSPATPNAEFQLDWTFLDDRRARLSWASSAGKTYQVMASDNGAPFQSLTNVVGRPIETEVVVPARNGNRLIRVQAVE